MKKWVCLFSFMLMAMFALTGCNTVRGTVNGAKRDVREFADTVSPSSSQTQYRKRYVRKTSTTTATQKQDDSKEAVESY